MKRAILLTAAGAAVGLAFLAGCSDKACGPCGTAMREPCCPAEGEMVIQGQGTSVEHRTEVPRRPATRPAR